MKQFLRNKNKTKKNENRLHEKKTKINVPVLIKNLKIIYVCFKMNYKFTRIKINILSVCMCQYDNLVIVFNLKIKNKCKCFSVIINCVKLYN